MTNGNPPASSVTRALQAGVIASLAAGLVLMAAALSASTFDILPSYLDVVLVVFVLPFVLLLAVLMFGVKIVQRVFPGWLSKPNGHELELPALLAGGILAASIAAIYPGMFPAKTYANLVIRGTASDAQPATVRRNAAYYSFDNATLQVDLSGSRSREVILSDGNFSRTKRVPIHAAPIVGRGWTPNEPVVAWAVSEEGLPPWLDGPPRFLEGRRLSDVRGDSLRAVRSIAKERELNLARKLILIEPGESYGDLVRRSRRRTWIVLGPLCMLVFAGTGLKTWSELEPEDPA